MLEKRVVLKNVADRSRVEDGTVLAAHRSAVGFVEPGDDPEETCFADARGPEERNHLPGDTPFAHAVEDLERDVREDRRASEGELDAGNVEENFSFAHRSCRPRFAYGHSMFVSTPIP